MGNLREFVLKKKDALMFLKCPCQNFTAPAWIGLDHYLNYFIGFYLIVFFTLTPFLGLLLRFGSG